MKGDAQFFAFLATCLRPLNNIGIPQSVYQDMRTHTAVVTLMLVAATLVGAPLSAQTGPRELPGSKAQLHLRVVDQTGAVLPLTRVTIYTLDGNPAITVSADEKGVASLPKLPSGLAEIFATFPGFSPYIEAIRLRPGKNAITATLRLAPVTEQVIVTASPEFDESGS